MRIEIFSNGIAILFASLLFNFLETWYFGWNHKASCPAEMIADYISTAGIWIGFCTVIYSTIAEV